MMCFSPPSDDFVAPLNPERSKVGQSGVEGIRLMHDSADGNSHLFQFSFLPRPL
jgi:hypothetical protein